MAFTKLTTILNKISTLATIIRGQESTVKAAFDYDVNVVKTYINDTLIPELEQADSENMKLANLSGQAVYGTITFDSNPIVPTPISDLHASTKKYVDDMGASKTADLNAHKTSTDHDSRYFTETELGSIVDGNSGADKIGVTPIPTLAGENAQAVLESIKGRLDNIGTTNTNVELSNSHYGANGQTYASVGARCDSIDAKLVEVSGTLAETAKQVDLATEITNRNSAVTAERNERLAEVAAERSRIDSFTALAAGSTTGDAELIDGRVGADGKAHTNIGGAIREQVSELNNDLKRFGGSYAPIDFILSNGALSTTDGSETTGNTRVRSSLAYIKSIATIILKTDYQALLFRYNADGSFIEYINNWYSGSFNVPYDGYYRLMIRHYLSTAITTANVTINGYYDISNLIDANTANLGKDKVFSDFCSIGGADQFVKNVKVYGYSGHLAISNIRRNYSGKTGVVLYSCDANGGTLVDIADIGTTTTSYHVIYNIGYNGVIEFDVDLSSLADGARWTSTGGLLVRISPKCYHSYYPIALNSFCMPSIANALITNVKVLGASKYKPLSLANIRRNYNGQTGVVLFDCNELGIQGAQIENIITGIKEHVVREYSWGKISFDIDLTNIADGARYTGSDLGYRISPNCYYPLNGFERKEKYTTPILTIVDDDGKSAFINFSTMLSAKGVACTFAIITDKVGTVGYMTLAEIMSLKASGYDIISHSASHDVNIFGSSSGTGNYTNFALVSDDTVKSDLKRSYDYLVKYGLNSDGIAFPWGHYPEGFNTTMNNPDPNDAYVCGGADQRERYTRIAREVGYKYGLNSMGGILATRDIDDMYISREPLYSATDIAYYKGLLDSTLSSGGWLILMTHAADSTYGGVDMLASIVDYAISIGVSVKTLKDAIPIKKNAVSIGYYNDRIHSLTIGADGKKRNI